MPALRPTACLILLVMVTACDSGSQLADSESQRFFFVESLKLVESAGSQLQGKSLEAGSLPKVFEQMDNGLKLAFQVEAEYLDRFDPRLSKNYQRYFVKGVEAYRLGIEAGDAAEQKNGLRLLSQWASFWADAGQEILTKMQE